MAGAGLAAATLSGGILVMAALIALGLCFGVFAVLNLIDNKRLD